MRLMVDRFPACGLFADAIDHHLDVGSPLGRASRGYSLAHRRRHAVNARRDVPGGGFLFLQAIDAHLGIIGPFRLAKCFCLFLPFGRKSERARLERRECSTLFVDAVRLHFEIASPFGCARGSNRCHIDPIRIPCDCGARIQNTCRGERSGDQDNSHVMVPLLPRILGWLLAIPQPAAPAAAARLPSPLDQLRSEKRGGLRPRSGTLGTLAALSGAVAFRGAGVKSKLFQWLRSLGAIGRHFATLFPMRVSCSKKNWSVLHAIYGIYPP